MSLEDQYDAWVRSVTGTGRHSATKQDRDAAQNSLNAMQAQLDALAESQTASNLPRPPCTPCSAPAPPPRTVCAA